MAYIVRPASEIDQDDVAHLLTTCESGCAAHLGVWQSALGQTIDAPSHPRCWSALVSQTGQLIGSGACRHDRLDKFRLDIVVHPHWRGQGVGARLLAQLETGLQATHARTVHTRVPDTATDALRFFEHRGFVATQHMVELRLAVQTFDPVPWSPLLEQMHKQGLTFRTMHDELQNNPACWEQLQHLQNAILPTWPDFDPGPVQLLEGDTFRRQLESFDVIPQGFFIAKHDADYVGYSGLSAPQDDNSGIVRNSGTAVLPAYRNRHLATALKVHALTYARQHGFTTAITGAVNPAMVRINEKLGFKRHATEVRLVKSLARKR